MQINSEKHIIRANITESQLEHIKANQDVNVTRNHPNYLLVKFFLSFKSLIK